MAAIIRLPAFLSDGLASIAQNWRTITTNRPKGHWKGDYRNAVITIAAGVPLVGSRLWYGATAPHFTRTEGYVYGPRHIPFLQVEYSLEWERWAASILTLAGLALFIAALCTIGGGRSLRAFWRGTQLGLASTLILVCQLTTIALLLVAYASLQRLIPPQELTPLSVFLFYSLVIWGSAEIWLRLNSSELVIVDYDADPNCPECRRLRGVLRKSEELLENLKRENDQLRERE